MGGKVLAQGVEMDSRPRCVVSVSFTSGMGRGTATTSVVAPRQLQTLDQTGAFLGHVLDDDITAPVPEEAIQGRIVCVLCYSLPDFDNSTSAAAEQLELIATSILEEEPATITTTTNGSACVRRRRYSRARRQEPARGMRAGPAARN